MSQPFGIDKKKAALGQCMAVGCERVPLYRSQGKGGYCKTHKSLAVKFATRKSANQLAYFQANWREPK